VGHDFKWNAIEVEGFDPMQTSRPAFLAILAGLALASAACGSSGDNAVPTITVSPPATILSPAPSASTTSTEVPARVCGVDLGSPVIQSAIATLPMEQGTRTPWSTDPRGFAGNFNPCTTLSTVIITIQGATGSSPNQALLFHQGSYVGTATRENYGFTALDPDHTTDDTVGLTYKTPGSCNACSDGTYTHVQFHWDGKQVQMIGAPPK
jgi:hypothetical protein